MGSYMMYNKNTNGLCPYCKNANNFSILGNRRPFQLLNKCNVCNKYSILNERNGTRYPLEDPLNSESMPKI